MNNTSKSTIESIICQAQTLRAIATHTDWSRLDVSNTTTGSWIDQAEECEGFPGKIFIEGMGGHGAQRRDFGGRIYGHVLIAYCHEYQTDGEWHSIVFQATLTDCTCHEALELIRSFRLNS